MSKKRIYLVLGLAACLAATNVMGYGKINEIKLASKSESLTTNKQAPYLIALQKSLLFYDANKCGKDAGENNVFDWRNACHITDGKDVELDLSGGYHDCGDHVKFGITQGYSASVLGWSYYRDKASFEKAGISQKTLETLKHFTDYLLKCHPNTNVYYYQVGDGYIDHAYWGAPEAQGDRTVIYKVDKNTAGSDVTGEAAAALAIMYLNYKEIDESYAVKCLNAAKSLYTLGNTKYGTSKGQEFYQSSSYKDDLAWAAIWLYEATGAKTYLEDAKKFASPNETDSWTMCWDNMKTPVHLRLYECTKDQTYLNAVKANIDYWINSVPETKGGLKYLDKWGTLRYSAAESMIAMYYYKLSGDERAKKLAVSQINYILGDNPNKMSYVIGYGNKYPLYPHHRAANGYTYANGDNLKAAKHLLTGALVGGPDFNDTYNDSGSEYTSTEVGLDYNAGLVGALATMIDENIIVADTPGINTQQTQGAMAQVMEYTGDYKALDVALTNHVDSAINQQYEIKIEDKAGIDLSKLKIRYYYTRQGESKQSFWCDHAGLQLMSSPWYEEITTQVKGTFYKGYVEVTFDSNKTVPKGSILRLGIRFAQSDWSAYKGFQDKGYKIYYDGEIVS